MCIIFQIGWHSFCCIRKHNKGFSIACYIFSFTVYFGDFIKDTAARLGEGEM